MWLAITTRGDISAAVGILGAFVSSPLPEHWNAVKRIFRYLKGTAHYVLRIGGYNNTTGHAPILEAYSDADHAGDRINRRSRSGGLIQLNGSTIIYFSRKQGQVAVSSTESERVGAHEVALEIMWGRKSLVDFNYKQSIPTMHRIDNMGAIAQVNNEGESSKEKHMEVQYHYMKELVQGNHIFPKYINTNDNISDMFTKPLPYDKFIKFRAQIGILDPNENLASSWGVVGSDPRHNIPYGHHNYEGRDIGIRGDGNNVNK
jgi:hypothetical protein